MLLSAIDLCYSQQGDNHAVTIFNVAVKYKVFFKKINMVTIIQLPEA